MGVESVGTAEILRVRAAAAPAPQARTAEPAKAQASKALAYEPEPNEEQVQRAIETLREDPDFRDLPARLRIDDSSGRLVVQILDEQEQVVRQIPPEEVLKLAANFRELQGMLFDERT